MNNREVCHAWANQTKPSAKGSNLFFEGDTIYSYGYHFPIAKIYHDPYKEAVILFTSEGYSSTTAKHKSYTWQALHQNVITVPHVIATTLRDHQENIDYLVKSIADYIEKAKRAVKNAVLYLDSAYDDRINLRLYRDYFNIALNESQKKVLEDGFIPQELIDKCEQSDKQLELKRQQKAIEAEKEDVLLWLFGADKRRNFNTLALRIKDGHVETTKGARVSVDSAKILASLINKGQDVNGFKIDGYTVISYNDGILRIGCHEIPQSEVERISELLLK